MIVFLKYISNWLCKIQRFIQSYKNENAQNTWRRLYFVLIAHLKAKCIPRNLNVADFQCKQKEKYTLNVNIRLLMCSVFFSITIHALCLFMDWKNKDKK